MDDKKYVDCFTEIQHDWDISVVQGGNFWARCTFLNHTTASSEQRNSQQAAEEIIEHQHLTVGFEDDATFLVKEGKFDPFQQSPIFTIDESPDGKYLVMGGESGNLKVYEKENQELVSDLVGHLGDVTLARFFPSSRVGRRTTRRFSQLSSIVRAVEEALKSNHRDIALANMVRRLQEKEKEKLLMTAALHLEVLRKKQADMSILSTEEEDKKTELEREAALLVEGAASYRARLGALVGAINEVIEELRCELTELLTEEQEG